MPTDDIFEPLLFRNLTVKNRILRSNVSGRFDNYDGSGNQARINWETMFAKGGVGAIISSFVPVTIRGRIVPNYATIDRDERVPFWRALGNAVHEHDCRFIMQLSHAGRQRDIPGIEYPQALSSTDRDEPLHGFPAVAMTQADIDDTVAAFADGARRAREAGLDGVELHAANGYLFTQFLSSAINDRTDGYGGPLPQRARFLLEVVAAIRAEVGHDYHLQVKISAEDHNDALDDDEKPGNTLADTVQVCQWLDQAGVDAIHVSSGSFFPHPRNPAGDFPVDELVKTYDQLLSSGSLALRNYLLFRFEPTQQLFERRWKEARGDRIEGINLPAAKAIKAVVNVPVLCTGGFQTAEIIREAIRQQFCDAVTIARPLIANNDLVKQFAAGLGRPVVPCTYCNRCLVNAVENPLGCYDQSRYSSREAMIDQIMSVFTPAPFGA
jgi:2,4-dienoyl-CoA reductase-like NADH-dependent reductase (Old Yellow Enzyme family)